MARRGVLVRMRRRPALFLGGVLPAVLARWPCRRASLTVATSTNGTVQK